jgi:hypothetical protein
MGLWPGLKGGGTEGRKTKMAIEGGEKATDL